MRRRSVSPAATRRPLRPPTPCPSHRCGPPAGAPSLSTGCPLRRIFGRTARSHGVQRIKNSFCVAATHAVHARTDMRREHTPPLPLTSFGVVFSNRSGAWFAPPPVIRSRPIAWLKQGGTGWQKLAVRAVARAAPSPAASCPQSVTPVQKRGRAPPPPPLR